MVNELPTATTARVSRRQMIRRLMTGGVAVATVAVGLGAPSTIRPVEAASWCQCVAYVKNAYGLTKPVPGDRAENMAGDYLRSQGFRQVSGPAPWAIVVFSSQYPNLGSSVGHVALAARWTPMSSGWKLTVRGANQPKYLYQWAEQGCTNVSDWNLANPVPYQSPYVTYWVR